MIYKTFKAPTYKEAVLKAKMEMGNNVYIIGRKEVKEGGFLGLFSKTMTEIIVAKNEDIENRTNRNTTTIKNPQTESILQAASTIQKKLLTRQGESGSNEDGTILRELKEIKTRLEQITDFTDKEKERPYLDKLIHILNENDFSVDFIEQLRKKFEDELTLKEVQDPKILEEKFKGYLMKAIDTSGSVKHTEKTFNKTGGIRFV